MKPIYDVDDAFEEFMRKCFPLVKETTTQYRESRRIFYAGVTSVYYALVGDITKLPDTDAEKQLGLIDDQLVEFFKKRVGFNQ